MIRRCVMIVVLGMMTWTMIGCEAHGKIDDDGVKAKIEKD